MFDLTNLGDVKVWLGIAPAQTAADGQLATLITATSADFVRAIDRQDFCEDLYTEVRVGDGGIRMSLRHWPIAEIQSVNISGTAVVESPDKVAAGWYIDDDLDPERRNQLWMAGGSAFMDQASVVLTYTAGYASAPADVSQAVLEWVVERYKGRPGEGINSQREAGGEHVTYERSDAMPATTAQVVERYKREWPGLNKYREDRDYKITRINRTTTTTVAGPVK
jgi:hypothetical protein